MSKGSPETRKKSHSKVTLQRAENLVVKRLKKRITHMTNDIYTTYHVTFAQVNACHRIGSTTTRGAYYQVESSKDDGTEYTVEYNRTVKALTCTCPAGNPPVLENGKLAYEPKGCWHKRGTLAHAAEFRANRKALQEKEEAQAVIEIAAEVAEDKLNRLQAEKAEATARKANGNNAYNRKPFQFLRYTQRGRVLDTPALPSTDSKNFQEKKPLVIKEFTTCRNHHFRPTRSDPRTLYSASSCLTNWSIASSLRCVLTHPVLATMTQR